MAGIKVSNLLKLVISVLITEGAGGIGSIFTFEAIPNWYASLAKTAITPPNWLFAPMWVTLYLLMGISFYIIWSGTWKSKDSILPSCLFGFQLFLNVLWSALFFGLHSLLFGAIEIVFLWFFILATILEFYRINRGSAYLLFPYLAWVTIAALLNMTILFANA